MDFRYRVRRASEPLRGRRKPKVDPDREVLVGELQGKKAYVTEERWARAMLRTGKLLMMFFQFELGVRGTPGYRQLDFLVNTLGEWRGFEVDNVSFVHRGDRKMAEDKLADVQRMTALRRLGVDLRRGIEHIPDTVLTSQADADREARNTL